LSSAINGAAIARGTSFLKDRLGQQIFSSHIFVHDDPRRVRGSSSKTFDAEGVPTHARAIVDKGVLTTWFLDSRSARQLGLQSTGHAARGTGGPPTPSSTNLYMAAGTVSPTALMEDIVEGIYITELLGSSINSMTGDYSRGASGFMIRNGALAEPVAEITVAGNLLDMFSRMVPADDLRFRRGTDAPTVRIDGMVVAGA
jgi:PmbA protein